MKLSSLFFFLFLMAATAIAQNKTLGIGVATPNPNAALHVEAPTANQGFIMPRLTTTQRTATPFVSALTAVDNGLLVYDTDLKNIYIWNGASWVSSAKPTFPFGESVENTLPNSSLFSLVNTGTTAGFFGVAAFENTNPNTSFSALYAKTNSSINGAADFVVDNPLNNNNGIEVNYNGLGNAGRFVVNNASNAQAAVYGITNSTGGVAVYGATTSTGAAIQGYTATGQVAIYGKQEGMGTAGFFEQTNTSVWTPGLIAQTNGLGAAFSAVSSTTSTNANAAEIHIDNPANPRNAIVASTAGTGTAIRAETSLGYSTIHSIKNGATNGFAGLFELTNASNTYQSLKATTTGTGGAAFFENTNASGTGSNVLSITNSPGGAFRGSSTGSGYGAWFEITNSGNGTNALITTTAGTGAAIYANHTGASGSIATFQSSGANVARIDKTGRGFFNGGTQTGGADVAELFDVIGDRNSYEPGDVLVISERKDRTVEKSNEQSSTRVVGVYATKPGVLLTEKGLDENIDHLVPMGVIGVIPTKVCTENGVIRRGDLLVTSSKPGYAMKAIPVSINGVLIYPTGAILGKALENLDKETGLINVFVNVK